ncbi:MAG: hypothetical protein GY710_13490 [Desulfobacteraceae bacterium]|nr:hypothetical protein [Desulfobacteraceae bacterium]
MLNSIKIRSSQEGFRRCGEFHSKNFVTWPGERFNEKELELLLAEPKLSVIITQGVNQSPTKENVIEKTSNNSLPESEKSASVDKDSVSSQPPDMAQEILEAARRAIADGNTIKSGAPDIKAMEQILDRNVDAAERDQAWDLIQTEAETKTQDKVEE